MHPIAGVVTCAAMPDRARRVRYTELFFDCVSYLNSSQRPKKIVGAEPVEMKIKLEEGAN